MASCPTNSGKLQVTPHWSRLDNGKKAPLEGSQEKMVLELTAPKLGQGKDRDHVFMDLVVVLDVSGSMSGQKLQKLQASMLKVIKCLRPRDHLCIISFDADAHEVFPLRAMDAGTKQKAELAVKALKASGGTNMQKGLQRAVDVINNISNTRKHAGAIILMSDGCENSSSNAREVPVQNIPVDTIGFGADQDHKVLTDISEKSFGGVFSNSLDVTHLDRVMSLLLYYRKNTVITDLVLTLEQEPTMRVQFGTYPQETGQHGTIIIKVGSLIAEEKKRVMVNFYLPPAEKAGNETVMKVHWKYRLMPGAHEEQDSIRIEINRTEASIPPCDIPKKVQTEEIRLTHVETIKDVRRVADKGNFDEAQEKLGVATNEINDAERKPPTSVSQRALLFLRFELEGVMDATMSDESYKNGGQIYVHACISSHDRQRFTTRGDEDFRVRLFTTPGMNQHLDEAMRTAASGSSP